MLGRYDLRDITVMSSLTYVQLDISLHRHMSVLTYVWIDITKSIPLTFRLTYFLARRERGQGVNVDKA